MKISFQLVSMLEHGKRKWTPKRIDQYRAALGIRNPGDGQ
jgi:hypothetical protein